MAIVDYVYVCDYCKGDSGEFNWVTGNHVSCEEIERLQKENKSLRQLVSDLKEDGERLNKALLDYAIDDNTTIGYGFGCRGNPDESIQEEITLHADLMEKLEAGI
jgi:hypothetical protein